MDLPDHDNFQKWSKTFLNARKKKLTQLILWLIVIACVIVAVLFHRSKVEGVTKVSSDLNEKLEAARTEIASLRHTNQNLLSENNRFRIVLDPIQRLYPQLELTAAVSKLGDDVESVRRLAESSMFKARSPELNERLLNNFKAFKSLHPSITNVSVWAQVGNLNRQSFAESLVKTLNEAGIQTRLLVEMIRVNGGPPPSFPFGLMYFPDRDQSAAETLATSLSIAISGDYVMNPIGAAADSGTITVLIVGEPKFLSNGEVVFRKP